MVVQPVASIPEDINFHFQFVTVFVSCSNLLWESAFESNRAGKANCALFQSLRAVFIRQ
jgi:hypothetical protein